MTDNMKHWNRLAKVPTQFLKAIGGGKLKGKSDINPQWRIMVMTDTFGPCGIGWKYEIWKLWTEQGAAGEICAFSQIAVFVKDGDKWSDPIMGIGGSQLIQTEHGTLTTNDEAFKMATTDALSYALKCLGVGADIYLGLWDGSKYHAPKEDGTAPLAAKTAPAPAPAPTASDDEEEHWCTVHNCKFYKKEWPGGGVSYSHKIQGTNQYCKEPKLKDPAPTAAAPVDPDDPHNW